MFFTYMYRSLMSVCLPIPSCLRCVMQMFAYAGKLVLFGVFGPVFLEKKILKK